MNEPNERIRETSSVIVSVSHRLSACPSTGIDRVLALLLAVLMAYCVLGEKALSKAQEKLPKKPRILSRTKVFIHPASDIKDPANRNGFNHAPSVTLLPDGRLLAVWFSGPFEGSLRQSLMGSYSSDHGFTWTAARVVQDFGGGSDFDPAFIRSGSRSFLFFSAGIKKVAAWEEILYKQVSPNAEVGDSSMKVYSRYTDDSGRNWSDAVVVYGETSHTSRSNGIELSTGELLLPVHRLGTKAGGVLKSVDKGRTWKRFGVIATPAGQGGEPSVVELKSGRIMMVLRTTDGYLWRAFSGDKGKTWMLPENTGMRAGATSHSLFRMKDGRLVLTHNPSTPPLRTPLTLRLSSDDGNSWGEPVTLAEVALPITGRTHQVAYPSLAELPGKMLVVVWTEIFSPDEDHAYGDIHSARLQVN
ncbi:MAG: glycoside hydrolase [Acidobacteria bacterium]|nr:glycoside hydrolase [Acidobacteriota bacterium]MCI0722062.1 glycoside hydrolase [Acidobacteriota bacterium]